MDSSKQLHWHRTALIQEKLLPKRFGGSQRKLTQILLELPRRQVWPGRWPRLVKKLLWDSAQGLARDKLSPACFCRPQTA